MPVNIGPGRRDKERQVLINVTIFFFFAAATEGLLVFSKNMIKI